MKRTLIKIVLPLLAGLFLLSGCFKPSEAQQYNEGIHYGVINPPIKTLASEGQVEVAEVFWYGCPHCYSLEPTIKKYKAEKPENVDFVQIPATLSARWAFHAKLFYVGRLLDPDNSKKVHESIFAALHEQRRRIDSDDAMRRFFQSMGFTAEQVNTALKSPELTATMNHAKYVTANSGLDSVPSIIVNGRYITSPSMTGGSQGLLDVVNYLVSLESK